MPAQPKMDVVFDFLGFQQVVPAFESSIIGKHVNSIYITTVASD